MAVLAPAHADVQQTPTQVYLSPESYTVPDIGSTFSLNISIQNVTNLFAWELKLYYPNDVLNGTTVTEGNFLKAVGVNTFFYPFEFNDNYNATHGRLGVACTRLGEVAGVDGGGVLATVTFNSTSNGGPENLHLSDVKLSDPNATKIPFYTVDGEVTVLPEFSTAFLFLFLMTLTLLAIILRKRLVNHRGIFHTA